MNNFEKIKQMTVEEMAELIEKVIYCNSCPATDLCEVDESCGQTFKKWLLQECE